MLQVICNYYDNLPKALEQKKLLAMLGHCLAKGTLATNEAMQNYEFFCMFYENVSKEAEAKTKNRETKIFYSTLC